MEDGKIRRNCPPSSHLTNSIRFEIWFVSELPVERKVSDTTMISGLTISGSFDAYSREMVFRK